MNEQQNIQLVCFDLGRVLIELCEGWAHACEVAGLTVAMEEPGLAIAAQLHDAVVRNEVGLTDQATFTREVGELVGLTAEQLHAVSTAWLRAPYAGGVELIDQLNAAGLRTACLSNTNAYHWQLMTTPGSANHLALDRLHYRFASHLVGSRKPDPAIYAHVEQETGLPGPAILFFDDRPENIDAARQRGWYGHLIAHPCNPITEMTGCLQRLGVWREGRVSSSQFRVSS